MTSSTVADATTAPRSSARGRALGWAAAAGTLPYLTLKAVWLSGGHVGVSDPDVLRDPSIVALNCVTIVLDLAVIGLALALTHPWGRRLPAWMLLLPMWIGSGLLLPMALAILPATLLGTASGPAAAGPLEPWVQPLVYGGFAWQGVFLTAAFVLHARRRWSELVTVVASPSRALAPLLRVLAVGGTVVAALSAALELMQGVVSGTLAGAVLGTIDAGFAVAGAAGVLALVRGTASHRWLAAAAAWAGTGAMFAWGLWTALTTMAGSALATVDPLAGMVGLTGLLAGFALAVAGLLALLGTGVARPAAG